MKPINTKVLVKVEEPTTKSSTGIIIPDSADTKPKTGEVIAVGTGREDYVMKTKPGDKVLFQEVMSMTKVDYDGEQMLIMDETQILAIV